MSGRAYEFGGFRLETGSRRLLRGGVAVPITVKAFDTLAALVEQAGRVLDKDELLRRIWPDAIVEEANLSQQIFLLRKALGEDPRDHRFVATVPRRGYRFVADVVELPEIASAAGRGNDAAAAAPIAATGAPMRLALPLAPGPPLALGPCSPFALSPDGRTLAYTARDGATTSLYLRRLDRLDVERVPRTEGAAAPFFSPDSRWVAYVANGRLRKVPTAGGSPLDICEAGGESRGAAWSCRDEIVFAPTPASGLVRVSAEGGRPRPLTELDFANGERTHRWPEALANGRDVLFTIARAGSASFEEAEIAVVSVDTGERRTVHRFGSGARLVASGHLVYMRGSTLMAVRFDAERSKICGSAMPMVDEVMTQPTGVGYVSVSRDGCLMYVAGDAHEFMQRLVWAANDHVTPLPIAERLIEEPRVSPDGGRIAFGIRQATSDIWIYEIAAGTRKRFTFDGDNFAPVWSPDSRRLTFSSNRNGPCQIFSQALEEAEPTLIVGGEHDLVPGSWLPGGDLLLFTEYNPATGAGVWSCAPLGSQPPHALVRSRANTFAPAVSPDGLAFAYASDESGRLEIYVASLRNVGETAQITTDGGAEPLWSADGGRLYYRHGPGIAVVDVDPATKRPTSAPIHVVEGPYQPGSMTGLPNYDVAPDGRLLLVAQRSSEAQPDRLAVTVRWFADIVQRLA
jgi:DNA-binding winged helix-turn-helix (wHTH) protein/Tol biopolymer transport system component